MTLQELDLKTDSSPLQAPGGFVFNAKLLEFGRRTDSEFFAKLQGDHIVAFRQGQAKH
jgi:hypothetical protein